MVVKKKEHFYSLMKAERRLPPILTMQVWDNDIFTPDDVIGVHNKHNVGVLCIIL